MAASMNSSPLIQCWGFSSAKSWEKMEIPGTGKSCACSARLSRAAVKKMLISKHCFVLCIRPYGDSQLFCILLAVSRLLVNKTSAMHRDNFRLQLTKNRRLIKNFPSWQTQFISDLSSKFGNSAIFSYFRFLLSKRPFTSDITSKIRIVLKQLLVDIY